MSGLAFGTAGIRAPLGPGPGSMNRHTVRRLAAALAGCVRERVDRGAQRGVVVARDARHGSEEFAQEAVEVLRRLGVVVHRFDGPVPTPLATFAVLHLGAAAGVVVTASHNPATDNGIKVVWEDGAQVIAPVDAAIATEMERIPFGAEVAAPAGVQPGEVVDLGGAHGRHPVVLAYLERAASLADDHAADPVRVAVTALHGVGATLLDGVLGHAGHEVHHVEHQRRPHPDFPSVESPNPEDAASLSDLLALASEVDAEVALALDPDADRLAVAVPDAGGAWRVLTGDEVGVVLLHHLLERSRGVPDRLVATTIVSSRLAGRMCAAAGVHFRETATGFKWLCRPGIEHPGWHQVLLYEEALGYAVGDARDKDGITAALVALDALAAQRTRGRSLPSVLDDLAREHETFTTLNGSLRLTPDAAAGALARLAGLEDGSVPALAGHPVVSVDRPAPSTVRVLLGDDTRVVVRPSGTEPKVKYYLEAVDAPEPAHVHLESVLADLRTLLGH